MVRHTSVAVPPGVCYGRTDVPLRDTFAAEAEAVRRQLAGVDFDTVWSSPLSRCTRLAAACGYPEARLDDRLRELHFGEWEGQRFDEIRDPQLKIWYADYLHARPTGGETFDEQCARVADFLNELRVAGSPPVEGWTRSGRGGSPSPAHKALIFTHGGVMIAAGLQAGLFTPEEAFSLIPPHGTILKIASPPR